MKTLLPPVVNASLIPAPRQTAPVAIQIISITMSELFLIRNGNFGTDFFDVIYIHVRI